MPFRGRGEAEIARALESGRRVIHISSHSFTPVLDGVVRQADVGLLYDPARAGEAALCKIWLSNLKAMTPDIRVRRNYPYTGKSDGFTAWLRRRFPPDAYIGIEVEINQAIVLARNRHWQRLRRLLITSLTQALGPSGGR